MLFLVRNWDLVRDREKTHLTAPVATTGTVLTVKAIDVGGGTSNTWNDNDFVIVGEIGAKNAEILQLNGAPASGTSITVDNNGSGGARFSHSIGEPVYRIDYNRIQFARATTETGAKTTLATNNLQPAAEYTRYEDVNNTTGFGFVRFYNTTSFAFSSYCDAIPYTGYTPQSLGQMMKNTRRKLGNPDYRRIDDDDIRYELNEAQRDIAHERVWSFFEGTFSASTVAYQRKYAVSSSAVYGKVYDITVDSQPLAPIDQRRYSMLNWDTNTLGDPTHFKVWNGNIEVYPLPSSSASSTTLNGGITATDTSITLTSASSFRSPGRALIESEVISYEYADSTTLYGCERGLEGTTAATHANATAITERDLVYRTPIEPTNLVDIMDETPIPDPAVLEDRAAMNLAIGKLSDQTLHDRFKVKYEQGIGRLRDKFGEKTLAYQFTIKDKNDVVRDVGVFRDPNQFPTNVG